MNLSIRKVLLIGSVTLLMACLLTIVYLLEVLDTQAKHYGELQSRYQTSLSKNLSLATTVNTMKLEARAAQLAADELLQMKAQRSAATVQTVKKIKEVLIYETCVDVPIPHASEWLYYH